MFPFIRFLIQSLIETGHPESEDGEDDEEDEVDEYGNTPWILKQKYVKHDIVLF